MSEPIKLYYWPTPSGWKISTAIEEMGLHYEGVAVNIGAGDQSEPKFQTISPNGRMPAIVDPDGPDGKAISIFESGAILRYLGRKTGQFHPRDERGRVEVDAAQAKLVRATGFPPPISWLRQLRGKWITASLTIFLFGRLFDLVQGREPP